MTRYIYSFIMSFIILTMGATVYPKFLDMNSYNEMANDIEIIQSFLAPGQVFNAGSGQYLRNGIVVDIRDNNFYFENNTAPIRLANTRVIDISVIDEVLLIDDADTTVNLPVKVLMIELEHEFSNDNRLKEQFYVDLGDVR